MPILEVQHLYKSFGSTKVLKDISFTLERGKAPVSYTHLTLPTILRV